MSQALPRSPELMNPGDTALLVIDVQERLLPGIADQERVAWNIRRLIDAAALLGVAVGVTEQVPEKLGKTVESLADSLSQANAGEAHSKTAFSSGACGQIARDWLAEGRRRVLLVGIETHACVQQTAFDYQAAGFQVYLAVDAVGSRHSIDHETALRRMDSAGVTLTTTETMLCEWCIDSNRPEFKAISALMKETGPIDIPY